MKTENKILTFKEIDAEQLNYWVFKDLSFYGYEDKEGFCHLIHYNLETKEFKDLLAGLGATWFQRYDNGDYTYLDEKRYWHLIIDGKDYLEGLNAVEVSSFENGGYFYFDEKGFCHLLINGKDYLEGLNAVDVFALEDGGYDYKDEKGNFHPVVFSK